ncbi:transposase, partial [Gammaproteobacteria bacterium]|nr:transposase [Gammaproteobacteria bacterium]
SKQWPDERMAIIMDQAGWYCSKTLIIPPNIIPIYLPPYSPELNPIEQLWLHIKKGVLNNKVYMDLKDLEKALCQFINLMDPLQVKQICSANHLVN